ncbi:MAG: OpcA protein [Cellulomonas sp. 73-145]|jgi:glucose-6-phosphate dehydrogenase assembly protein OpcA|uniref:glucose-6-phosphate dehydrogenase assembly protein OpcA n=1 Tax=unclassified Cellulomonas TaxID=2620175 RepID=UPI00092946A0|nr:glucose-6-phosphate dehydrogenase assembly protein OpcA [Cellulomonas sp. 73-145]OJV60933.1 MAG: OpcA protein [Cellulomonas sp. 73-145]OZB50351.1 MAG: OpcA protein [Cellulomonas sp. 14-74-6]BDO42156.1 glucose-6-phosphate dehydrogenase assembly protein OpcA [Cellulomonas sp. NTE-D12]
MIIDLPSTTTREINRRLVRERDEGGVVALGRVMNLLIDTGDHDPEDAIAAANLASREHPCRIIVLSTTSRKRRPNLDAQIRLGGDAGASEVILLWPAGDMDQEMDTLITPLLLPDAPTVVWWPNEVPENPSAAPLGRMGRRRITDTTQCTSPSKTLERLASVYQDGDTDLAWARATLWRGLIAATLEQPPYEPVHRAVVVGESTHPSVDLMAAWLAWALRCPVHVERVKGAPAITQVRLERSSGPIVLDRPDGKTAALHQPDQPDHRIALPIRQLGECLVEELRRLDPDEVYGEVLTKGLARIEG